MQSTVQQQHPVEAQIVSAQTHTIGVETQMSEARYNPEGTPVYF
jgi:hypothetical protein